MRSDELSCFVKKNHKHLGHSMIDYEGNVNLHSLGMELVILKGLELIVLSMT